MSVEIEEILRGALSRVEVLNEQNKEPEAPPNPFPAASVAFLVKEFAKLERFFATTVSDHNIQFSYKPVTGPSSNYWKNITAVDNAAAGEAVLSMASFFVKIHEADLRKLKARDEMIIEQKKD